MDSERETQIKRENISFECHVPDSTARNIAGSEDSEPRADFLSYSSHSTNLSETRVSE